MLLPLLLALSVTSTARAEEGLYMWGVGPTISTMVMPGKFPNSFPKIDPDKVEGDFSHDLNDKNRIDSLNEVRGDASLGGRGVIYFNPDFRAGLRFHLLTAAKDFNNLDLTFEFDKILFKESKAAAFLGGGVGVGKMKFTGSKDEDFAEGKTPELSFNTYVLRAHAGGIYRLKQSAIELDLFVEPPILGIMEFQGQSGDTTEIEGIQRGNYWHLGAEATVYFGDFVPPKNRKNKKGKGGKKGRR